MKLTNPLHFLIISKKLSTFAYGILLFFKRHQDCHFGSKLREKLGFTIQHWGFGRPIQRGRRGERGHLMRSCRKCADRTGQAHDRAGGVRPWNGCKRRRHCTISYAVTTRGEFLPRSWSAPAGAADQDHNRQLKERPRRRGTCDRGILHGPAATCLRDLYYDNSSLQFFYCQYQQVIQLFILDTDTPRCAL